MEFFDEDARPRFVLQSKPTPEPAQSLPDSQALHKPTLFLSLSISSVLFAFCVFYFTSEPFRSVLIWFSLSLLVGPFAPPDLTAGDIRVGLGPPIPEPVVETEISDDHIKRNSRRSAKSTRQHDSSVYGSGSSVPGDVRDGMKKNGISANGNGSLVKFEKSVGKVVNEDVDWDEADEELLKKLTGKHPVGKPGRWEAIAQGFSGRHSVESVIKRSKELGEKKVSDEDSYKKFLKDRKPVDKRVVEEGKESNAVVDVKGESGGWTPGDDLALLNALKAFPKDVAMRWEKIAAAVPGKTKTACMKRVSELKEDFRSSKAASSET